ncbi:sporulation protein YpjB [Aquisalibacillus elongatus]|uniref:Sporulation protein YpjB n=1 Tax=Aquisalibacillus elongatus TaxID=485577 RepID=A0A3N5BKI9_9BACI|nr:sporulation protein YpjB [Aquisalibacillus elongatus]RPF55780.1 sporulation protein YpjB [Aquisalibacillus elongatus]
MELISGLLTLATHASISAFFVTIFIIFGAVVLTLSYVGWKKYHDNDETGKNIDQENEHK